MKLKRTSLCAMAVMALVFLLTLAAPATTVNCSGVPAWAPNTAFTAGQLVTFGGSEYKCVQSHTSQVGWEPPNVPALWSLQGSCGSATPTPTATPTATKKPTASPTPTPNSCTANAPPAPMATVLNSSSVALSNVTLDPIPGCAVPTYNWYKNGTLLANTSSASYTATGLIPLTIYNFTEAIVIGSFVSPQSAPTQVAISDATPTPTPTPTPTCPAGVSNFQAPTVTVNSATSATIGAIVATATPMPGCSIAPHSVNFYANGTLLANQTGLSYTANGLTPSVTYSFTTALVINGVTQSQTQATTVTMPSASTPTPTPTKPTPTPTPTPVSGGNCSGLPAWALNVHFTAGELVTFQGNEYQCLQTNTALPGWDPVDAPALWRFIAVCSGSSGSTPTPTPTPLPTASATPNGSTGGNLPKHVLMGFWQDFDNGAQVLRISDVPTTYDVIAVAFGTSTASPGAVAFSVDPELASVLGGYSQSDFIADINTVHARGQKVILSIGGANGAISISDSTSAANFANSVHSLIATWGFDGVDIDLESGINVSALSSALQQLSSMNPGLIITTAPQTLDMQTTTSDYFALALDNESIITINNTQYYNSGSMNGCDGKTYSEGTVDFLTALACTQLQGGIPANEVGLGLPTSVNGASSGFVSPSVMVAALQCLAQGTNCGSFKPPQTWPNLRGAMGWSINWDASNGYNFANTVKPAILALP